MGRHAASFKDFVLCATSRGRARGWFDRHVPRASTGGDPASSGRLPVDIRRFPWIRRLASDYAFDFSRLADFFAGNPRRYRRVARRHRTRIESSRGSATPRADVLLSATTATRRTSRSAVQQPRNLGDPASVADRHGPAGGAVWRTALHVSQSLTALQLAERVRPKHSVPAVAVFWVDAEDHDWDEVKSCGVLDADARAAIGLDWEIRRAHTRDPSRGCN